MLRSFGNLNSKRSATPQECRGINRVFASVEVSLNQVVSYIIHRDSPCNHHPVPVSRFIKIMYQYADKHNVIWILKQEDECSTLIFGIATPYEGHTGLSREAVIGGRVNEVIKQDSNLKITMDNRSGAYGRGYYDNYRNNQIKILNPLERKLNKLIPEINFDITAYSMPISFIRN